MTKQLPFDLGPVLPAVHPPRPALLAIARCHRCPDKPPPKILHGYSYWGYSLVCPHCYDGAIDASNRTEHVDAKTAALAIEEWNEMQADLAAENEHG